MYEKFSRHFYRFFYLRLAACNTIEGAGKDVRLQRLPSEESTKENKNY